MSRLARRFLAIATDITPLAAPWLLFLTLNTLGFIALPGWADWAFCVGIFVYVGSVEALSGGLSPGKWLFGLRLVAREANSITALAAIRRSLLNSALFPFAQLCSSAANAARGDYPFSYFSAAPWSVAIFLLASQLAVLILTSGRVAIADLLMRTEIVTRAEATTRAVRDPRSLLRATVLAFGVALVVSLTLAISLHRVSRSLATKVVAKSTAALSTLDGTSELKKSLNSVLTTPEAIESVAYSGPQPCSPSQLSGEEGNAAYLTVPPDALPLTLSYCATASVKTSTVALLSSDLRLALGDGVARALRATSGPIGTGPQPTFVFLEISSYRFTGIFHSEVSVLLKGFFLPNSNAPILFFDDGFAFNFGPGYRDREK